MKNYTTVNMLDKNRKCDIVSLEKKYSRIHIKISV